MPIQKLMAEGGHGGHDLKNQKISYKVKHLKISEVISKQKLRLYVMPL
jgi:hypothetical protein